MNENLLNSNCIFLNDVKPNGKENNWCEKKLNNTKLYESYIRLDDINKAVRLKDCGTFLEFRYYSDTGQQILHKANFCKIRLCPMCAWRRSLKIFGQTSKIMNEYELQNPNDRYIFLTLTLKNCYGEDLKETIDLMFKAFKQLFKYKEIINIVKGYFRALEITYNYKQSTFHPHFHIVLAVDNEYLVKRTSNGKNNKYITQKKWTTLWKKALQEDYEPIVNVKVVKNKVSGVKEISKYSVKDVDYLKADKQLTDRLVYIFDKVLHNRRLFAYGLEFKKLHKKLNLDDVINGNMIQTDNEIVREDLNYIIMRYSWNVGLQNYILIDTDSTSDY